MHIEERKDKFTPEEKLLMESRNRKYLDYVLQIEKGKIDRLESEIQCNGSQETVSAQKIKFVDSLDNIDDMESEHVPPLQKGGTILKHEKELEQRKVRQSKIENAQKELEIRHYLRVS